MKRAKITIIGAGNVGATTAHWCAAAELGDIVLLDIPQTENMPKGKALDLFQAGPIMGFDARITGTTNYADTAGSDVVVITAGIPRKPGMSRDDLLGHQRPHRRPPWPRRSASSSPEAVVIVVSNPLDAMVQRALAGDRLPAAAGAGPGRRARYGPLPRVPRHGTGRQRRGRLGHAAGRPRRHDGAAGQLHLGGRHPRQPTDCPERLAEIIQRTRDGGAEIVSLLKTGSAYYAPAAATAQMVEAIVRDKKRLIPCAAYCDKEYGVGGYLRRRAGGPGRRRRGADHRVATLGRASGPLSRRASTPSRGWSRRWPGWRGEFGVRYRAPCEAWSLPLTSRPDARPTLRPRA